MTRCPEDAELQIRACGMLLNISFTYGEEAYQPAVVRDGGLAAVVIAMGQHVDEMEVQRNGCGALWNLAAASDA
eukprot:644304-Prymnesium_polylepis.1